jgi:integrase
MERVKTSLYGKGERYRLRYVGPDGRERSESFPDRQKRRAEDRLVEIENNKRRGSYVDPVAGNVLFRDYAATWLRTHRADESTKEGEESRIRNHLLPLLGHLPLASIKAEHIREWDSELAKKYAVDTRAVSFAILRAILNAAVDDKRIPENPCNARSVKAPKQERQRVVPWKLDRINAVRLGLNMRYKDTVDLAAGCGLRQGEIFGLAVDDLDIEERWLHVRRQVKRVRSQLVFGLPKNDKERRVPLPMTVARTIQRRLAKIPAIEVTLPWEDPTSVKLVTARLIFTSERRTAIVRGTFNQKHWRPALSQAGVAPDRENGIHALRHFYASSLLDAGRSIREVSEYLGHADPAFTLRTYAHLMPGGDERTREAIDGLLGDIAERPDDGLEQG